MSKHWILVLNAIVIAALVVVLLASRYHISAEMPSHPVSPTSEVIIHENSLPGSSSWQIPDNYGATTQIQAYANATYVLPGQKIVFYVSVQYAQNTYSIDIYRLGWYNGKGGRLMLSVPPLKGLVQGYYDIGGRKLVNCATCLVDDQTGLIEANWQPSYVLTVPSNWVSGVYLAKFTEKKTNFQTYVPFDVSSNTPSAYIAITPDTTYAAYNYWGGYSLYNDFILPKKGSPPTQTSLLQRGVMVSLDRPYIDFFGSSEVLLYEADAIHWMERQGFDVTYTSNVHLQEDPGMLLNYHAYISLGHDEYWTKEMRDGVENARNHGVGLAFLSANTMYWQIRIEPDSIGNPNRTIICYKVADTDYTIDPFYGKDNERVTAKWRDPLLNLPENAIVGIMYSSLTVKQQGFPWRVNPVTRSPLLAGTGLIANNQYGCDLVGSEWDRVFNNGATPAGLQVLSISNTVDENNQPDMSNTTYYITPSGAMVFATGSIYWANALDSYRIMTDPLCPTSSTVVPGVQKLMQNVMDALIIKH